jgi:hypothetical protein
MWRGTGANGGHFEQCEETFGAVRVGYFLVTARLLDFYWELCFREIVIIINRS